MDKQQSALLVMDMQVPLLQRLPDGGTALAGRVAAAIRSAREREIPVIFVRLGFRKGMPEVSPENKMFSSLKSSIGDEGLDAFMQIHPQLGMLETDLLIDKKRISAFSGNDLEMILRAQNIRHLVLTGIATSGIVLSTQREAFDKDFAVTILADCCADSDAATHEFLITKLLPRLATVSTLEAWATDTM
ncbi:isochorismatase family cysteine hydrolase [Rurimicrobium arvi]|uniref:Cysteine hydrolase n=1 Tax=Rurimicrobium arvi TaxID=2049916 RepID=A0ABP8N390_9BACT